MRTESFSLVMNVKAAEAAGKFVNQALVVEGVDALRIGNAQEPVATVTAAESDYFVPVAPTSLVSDNVRGDATQGRSGWAPRNTEHSR